MNGYDHTDLLRAASAGVRAPSMHNSQPWRFRLTGGAIDVLADPSRQLQIADSAGWALRLACGAATYNARLALAAAGRPAHVVVTPDLDRPDLIARLTPDRERPPTRLERDLFAAIARRHSNRAPFLPDPVPADVRVRLMDAALSEHAWLDLLVGMTALTGFSQIAHSADKVLRRNTQYQAELITWTDADAAPDSVPSLAGAPVTDSQDLIPQRLFAERHRAPGSAYEPEPLVGILGVPADRRLDQIIAGQALQKVLLTATDAGLSASMISQPIEVPAARDQLRRSLGRTGYPQLALRIGYGQIAQPTARRDVVDALDQAVDRQPC